MVDKSGLMRFFPTSISLAVMLCVIVTSFHLLLSPSAAHGAGFSASLGRSHAQPHASQSESWPGNPFSPSSVWNRSLGQAPIAADSRQLTNDLVKQVISAHGSWIDTWEYSDPVYVVARDQPDVHVTLDDENPALQGAFDSVPVPAGARAALGTDEHMTVWQPSTNRLWDFWHMHQVDGGWHARWGGEMNDVSQNPGYFENIGSNLNWGATATGLPLLGGLITFADLRRGYINHAVALAIPDTEARYWVWPAQRTDGNVRATGGSAIPEGTQFRLDPRLDLSALHLSPLALMIARAAQRYGIIVRDKGGAVTFFGQAPTGGVDPWTKELAGRYPNQALAGFPWSDLEVVRSEGSCCWAPH